MTVLGCGAAYPRPGGACSGFLVRAEGTSVWLDAGNGTFSRLQELMSYRELDALVLTHGHADHVADVLPLMYALGFDPSEPAPGPLPVHAPPDVEPILVWPLGPVSLEVFKKVFTFRTIAEPFEAGPLRFEPFRTKHPAETYGVRVTGGGRTLVYTSDTALFPGLAEACREADVLICESTYVDGVEAEPGVHLWAREAGIVARESGARRLVRTHVWTTFDTGRAVEEAAREFGGPIEAAAEGRRYTV